MTRIIPGRPVNDDRGRPVPVRQLPDPSFRRAGRPFRPLDHADPAARSAMLRRTVTQWQRKRRLGPRRLVSGDALLGIVLLCFLWVVVFLISATLAPRPAAAALATALAAAVVAIGAAIESASARSAQRALNPLPPACLACGYDMTGIPPEPDGCTVCPECGAAWNFSGHEPTNPA